MKVLFVADPVSALKPAGDSSLVLARECLRRGDEVHWVTPERVEYVGDHVSVDCERVVHCAKDALPRLEAPSRHRLDGFSLVFIRKDPPFDVSYVRLCWLLALVESKVAMVNRPSLLLRYHEKLLPLEAVAQGYLRQDDLIPTHIGRPAEAKRWVKHHAHDPVILKPFLGYGGRDIERIGRDTFLSRGDDPGEGIVQPYRREIETRGDRRVIYLDGKMIGHFARVPKAGGYVSNLAQGGSAVKSALLPEEADAVERLGKFLKAMGMTFAGADLIGRFVSEVNVTSPTGLRSLEVLEGDDKAKAILEAARALVP